MMRRSVGGRGVLYLADGGGGDREGEIHPADHITAWGLSGRMGLRRQDRWKVTFLPKPFGPGPWQLYDLSVDAGVIDDISAAYGDKIEELIAAYREYAFEMGLDNGQLEYGDVFGQDMAMR